MLFILSILGLIAVVSWCIRFFIRLKRNIFLEEMERTFDRMLLYITKNKLAVTPELKEFVVRHKIFVVNKEFSDIAILLALYWKAKPEKVEKNIARWQEIVNSIPHGLIQLHNEFSNAQQKVINLSRWKPQFQLHILTCKILALVRKGKQGIDGIKQAMQIANTEESSIALNFSQIKFAA